MLTLLEVVPPWLALVPSWLLVLRPELQRRRQAKDDERWKVVGAYMLGLLR